MTTRETRSRWRGARRMGAAGSHDADGSGARFTPGHVTGALEEGKLGVAGRLEVVKGEGGAQALDTAEPGGCHHKTAGRRAFVRGSGVGRGGLEPETLCSRATLWLIRLLSRRVASRTRVPRIIARGTP